MESLGDDEVISSGIFSGIRLYFCVRAACDSPKITLDPPYRAVWDFEGDSLQLWSDRRIPLRGTGEDAGDLRPARRLSHGRGGATVELYVDRVEWNGKPVEEFRIPAREIMAGGTLLFYMK